MPSTTVEIGSETGFILNDATAGVLDNTIYLLGGIQFTDITEYVYNVSIKRGKNRELDRYSAGTVAITLNNQERLFDPNNTESPFYSFILPRKNIRVTTDGIIQFSGYIVDWNFSYDVSGRSVASISGSDGFVLLAGQNLSGGIATTQNSGARVSAILSMPTVAWSNSSNIDTGKSVLGNDSLTGNALTYLQTVADSEQGAVFIDKTGGIVFKDRTATPKTDAYVLTRTNLHPNNTVIANTAQFTYLADYEIESSKTFVTDSSFPSGKALSFYFRGAGYSDQYNYLYAVSGSVTAGETYTASFYAKWVDATVGYSGVTVTPQIQWFNNVGTLISTSTGVESASVYSGARYSVTAVAPVAASYCRIVAKYLYPVSLKLYDFKIGAYQLEQSSSITQYFDGNTLPAGEYFYTFQGTPNSTLSYEYENISATPQPLFTDDGSGIPYVSATINYGTELLYNAAIVSSNAGTVTSNNTNSQINYGITALNLDTLVNSTQQLTDIGSFIVSRYSTPEYRFESLEVSLNGLDATYIDEVLNIELADIVDLVFTPNGLGDPIRQTVQVIRLEHNIFADRHNVVLGFELLPFKFFVLNDTFYGKLDGIATLGF